ncbi:MAG TPA: SRPBCC domain-containing protein [Jatrophihabitantaceae bacterium]|jgi:uncharacterized protein YndB with AHSA1/START domain|nr:SRPBCC domain-containing protein [Jatrophihabitantaceae bacterium]
MLHGEFEVSIGLGASPADVWAAFSDPAIRERWASIPGKESSFELDFRPGGHEIARGTFAPNGVPERIQLERWLLEIEPERRLVSAYRLVLDGVARWASLVTVTLDTGDTGTTLTHHEQYAFLAWTGDGSDDRAHLRGATQLSLNRLASVVESRGPS